jgi:hypothetical protein
LLVELVVIDGLEILIGLGGVRALLEDMIGFSFVFTVRMDTAVNDLKASVF